MRYRLLKNLVNRGMIQLDKSYYIRCKLHNVHDEMLKKIEPEIIKNINSKKGFLENFSLETAALKILKSETLPLELKCNSCKHIGTYDIKRIFLNKDNKEPYIAEEIACKNCSSISDFIFTANSNISLNSHILALDLIQFSKDEKPERDLIRYVSIRIIGLPEDSAYNIENITKEKLLRNPKNTFALSQLADLYGITYRHNMAIDLYKKVLEIEPTRLETYYRIASILEDFGNTEEALGFLEKGKKYISLLGEYKLYIGVTPEDFAVEYANMYNDFVIKLKKHTPLLHPTALTPKKLGRNEPCYCASGKKYKKCHGKFM